MPDQVIWGIHGGSTGDADSLFLKKKFVAVGWNEIGDLAKLSQDREAYKVAVATAFPEKVKEKPGAIPNIAGQLFRFVNEMQIDDIVVYPSKPDRQLHFGTVVGEYHYEPGVDPSYPHLRQVQWTKAVPRTHFSQGALYEVGSAMTFFQVKNYADELLEALHGQVALKSVDKDETVEKVVGDIEDTTRDFILKTLAQELKGHPLAHFVGHLLNSMGYRTRVSPEGPDGGIDIIAHRDELGFEPPIIKVQVKSSEGATGDPVVSALYGKVGPEEHGLLVTLGTFTSAAESFARSKSNLRLIDCDELVKLILAHYEQFDSRYKGILPLKRVYVPESLASDD